MECRYQKWSKWLDTVYSDITNLSRYSHIFWEVQEIIQNNSKIQKPSSFYEFLGQSYIAYVLIGIRRQIKIDRDSISFARLLKEIIDTPEILSRERFIEHYQGTPIKHHADEDFDKFAGCRGKHVDPSIVKKDLEKLQQTAKILEDYADKMIAHLDKRKPAVVPTFKDVDECIDFLEKLLKKYHLLIKCEALTSILPSYLYDWKAVFYEPWIQKDT